MIDAWPAWCRTLIGLCALCLAPAAAVAQPYQTTIGDVPPTTALSGGVGLAHMRTAETAADGTWLASLSRDNVERWPGRLDQATFLLAGTIGVRPGLELFG